MRWTKKPLLRHSLLALLLVGFAGIVIAALYVWNATQIEFARKLRRQETLAEADRFLFRCWHLPGQSDAIHLEAKLAAVQQGDLRDEATLRDRATQISDASILILESLSKGSMAVFRWNDAKAYADEILKRKPEHSGAIWLRGKCWVKLQQETRAIEDFKRAVSLSSGSVQYRLSLAELLRQQGFNADASKCFRELVLEKHFDTEILVGLSRCMQDATEYSEAERTLMFLLELRPNCPAALVERSRLSLRQGNPVEAEVWARKAVLKTPRNQEAISVLSLSLVAQGKQDTSLQSCIEEEERIRIAIKKNLRESPTNAQSLCQIGDFMIATDEELEGVGCYQRALAIDPKCSSALTSLADYFGRSGQVHLAQHYREASVKNRLETNLGIQNPIESPSFFAAPTPSLPSEFVPSPLVADTLEATSDQVHQLCGACHSYPTPDSFPKSAWRKEVQLGFDFLRDSSRSGLYPSQESVVRYYENRAPDRLPVNPFEVSPQPSPLRFEVAGGGWLKELPPFPATTHVHFARLQSKKGLDLIVCDARLDRVLLLNTDEKASSWSIIAPAPVPSHAEVVDLDSDGRRDIVVACLGQFYPTDDKVGSVVWLRATANGSFTPITVLEGVGRVADVQAADFDGDGLTDLIVAVFGWRKGGEILYLQNKTSDWNEPRFEVHRIDSRHGAIHVPIADINSDGLPDFVALISQEHESVVAFLNEGNGHFRKETLFAASHPAFGCSGIAIADMDLDNDLDVLLTNGDVLDRPYILKPYHGVHWLENRGDYPFVHHSIAPMYGACRAVAADMDADNDIDIVAVSFLPAAEFPERDRMRIPSAMFLEQTSQGTFAAHVLETGNCDHFSCDVADWNGDGRMDLALGNFSWKRSQSIPDAALLLKGTKAK